MTIKKRRLLIRQGLVVVWIGLGALLFVLNRGHSLLIDNRNVELPPLRAPDMITVTLDREKPLEFFRGDRDIFNAGGGSHRIRIQFSDGTPPFEKRFTLPLGPDMFLLSIPKMLNGVEPYIEEFHTQPDPRRTDDPPQADSFGTEGE
ncbi:MAG: hypothetical protein LBD47_14055 [Treponema sp.]|nr:hypothetical protein [Treponema sp.]